MKILIATPILFDEKSPFNHLFKDIIKGLLENNISITRLIASRNEHDDSNSLGIESKNQKLIHVIRTEAKHGNIIQRYIQDNLTAYKMARLIKKQNDVDCLFEDVCYSSFWTVRAAKKRGIKVIAMLQDIWPDNAVQSGLIKERSIIYRFFEFWQNRVYKYSDKVICISEDMRSFVISKGVPTGKTETIYNWGYTDENVVVKWSENEFVKKYSLDENLFYAIYAGNIGRMQNVEMVVCAAERLKSEEKIKFLIIGDGVNKEKIYELVAEKNLHNVEILPFQDPSLALHIYSAAGVNIIPLVKNGIKTALPSKTGICLSCGKPMIFCFGQESSFYRYCKEYNIGECVSSTDANELAQAILRQSKCNLQSLGNGRQLYNDLFSRTKNIQRYVQTVKTT